MATRTDKPSMIADEHQRHRQRYQVATDPAVLAVEMLSLGTDYGANGHTTMEQADKIGRLLGLDHQSVLVDVGSGCGWPGLHLASTHGCSVISVDPVLEGSVMSRQRAERDGMAERSLALVGDGTQLPLRSRSVDAIVHSDTLC